MAAPAGPLLVLALVAMVLAACSPGAEPAEAAAGEPMDVLPAGPVDPLGEHLALPPLEAPREEALLDSLRTAVRDARSGGSRSAIDRVDRLLAELVVVEDWRPLVVAEFLAPEGDTAGVRTRLEALPAGTELHHRWGRELLVEAHLAADDRPGAIRAARAEALHSRAGRLALSEGDTVAARSDLLRALEVEAGGARRAAARALHRLDGLDAEVGRAVGRALLEAGDHREALERLEPLLRGSSAGAGGWSDPGVADLRLAVSEARVGLSRGAEARAALGTLPDPDDTSLPRRVRADAHALAARAALLRRQAAEAERAAEALVALDPGSARTEEVLLAILGHVRSSGPDHREPALLALLAESGAAGSAGELELVRHGAELYRVGDLAGAGATFRAKAQAGRRTAGRQQARYWVGLVHDRSGEAEAAREALEAAWALDPYSFYGLFAGERLGKPVLPDDLPPGPRTEPEEAGEMADRVRNALTRLRVHQVVPTSGSFAHEVERLTRHGIEDGLLGYELAEALIEAEFPIQGIVMGRDLRRAEGAWNLRLLRIVHPLPHREALVRHARAQGLDPFFVAGLIRQESMFHPTIESSAGAVGLMQLMPGTAREVAASLGIRYEPARLGDPEYNLRLGTRFLAQMVRRNDGRAEDALSAYNAGPSRINQWRQREIWGDRDVFMEFIPFAETRHYVKVVQQYARMYAALWGCDDFQPCTGLSYQAVLARSPHAGGAPSSALAR